MDGLREKINTMKIAIACTLSEPMDAADLYDILQSIDTIFPEEYIIEADRRISNDR